jgi:hypothetical protein
MHDADNRPKCRPFQDNNHNIVNFPQRRPSKAEALTAYARATGTAERFAALMQLADARLIEQGKAP